MKPRTIPPILLILLTLTGCQSKNNGPEVISLHPSNLEIFSGPLEEILEVEKILPLETHPEALTGGIWGFAQSKSGILIRNKGNKSLLVFNEDGSFKTKIERVGKGPGDYVEVFGQDWIPSIDNKKDEIVLSDVYGKKLLFFSADGEFISEVKIPKG